MKKVYLNCYCHENIGDDLFVKIICERYKKTHFFISTDCELNKKGSLLKIPNLTICRHNRLIYKIFKKIAKVTKTINLLDKRLISHSDLVVTIAGSYFMEPKNRKVADRYYDVAWYKKIKKPYYIIGVNVGPIYRKQYLNTLKQSIFANAQDVCVRDKTSYDLLSDNGKVRFAPDIIFSLMPSIRPKLDCKKRVGISIIDCNRKSSQMKNSNLEKYEKMITKIIKYYEDNGYEVTLFSFCDYEKDNEAIDRIEQYYKKRIKRYSYKGDIEEFLSEFNKAQIIIGTRFHANILGFIMDKTVVPISYNDKTVNMLKDLNFEGEYIDLQKGFNVDLSKINDKNKVDNVTKMSILSNAHFEKLDKILK